MVPIDGCSPGLAGSDAEITAMRHWEPGYSTLPGEQARPFEPE